MLRWVSALVLLGLAVSGAWAQEPAEDPAVLIAARTCVDGVRPITAFELLKRTIGDSQRHQHALPSAFRHDLAAALNAMPYRDGPPSGTRLHLRLAEAGRRGAIVWQEVTFIAAAYPVPRAADAPTDEGDARAPPPIPHHAVPVRAERYLPGDVAESERLSRTGGIVVAVNRPEAAGWRIAEDWVTVVAVCQDKQLIA